MVVTQQTENAFLTLGASMLVFTDRERSAGGLLGDPSHPKAIILSRGLLTALTDVFLKPDLTSDDLRVPSIVNLLESRLSSAFRDNAEALTAELAHKLHGIEIVGHEPTIGPVNTDDKRDDTRPYVNGVETWMMAGSSTSRQIGQHVFTLVQSDVSLAGAIEPTDALDLAAMTRSGQMGLAASRGSNCNACAACSGCGLCALCLEVNADAAATAAVGLTGLSGVSS